MTDLWRCTVCGQVSTVGRCCGEETREPWRPIRRKDEEETRRIEAVADRAEQLEAEIEALRAEVDVLKAENARLREALQAIVDEVSDGIVPYSSDSYLPAHLVEQARAALAKENSND